MTDGTSNERYQVPALQRGMQLLGQFTRDERELTGAELSRRLGVPRASVFRLLQTLEQMGFVERVGDSANYKLGVAVLRLGFEYLASMELTEHGRPILDALSVATGLSAHLAVRDSREVVVVAKSTGRTVQFNSIQVGARLPAHATVLGRVLLGGQTLDQLHALYEGVALVASSAHTPTTVLALKQLIDADAERGFGISQGGYDAGISTVAAPVFDEHHKIAAVVNVTVSANRIDPSLVDALVAQVRQAADRLSERLNHLPRSAARPNPTLKKQPA
jgi:DNA-binding IclR family transcriptional regulator